MSKRARGFTIFEIIAALGILIVALGISLSALRSPGKKRAPDSAAGVLLTALQAAQSEARGKGIPTGLALACGDGEAAFGFYTLQGHVKPRIIASTDLRTEFPETYLVAAAWGGGLSDTVPNPGDDFLPAAWDPPHPKDPTLIFLPSGKVLSNGLFHQNGIYRFVVASGLAASPIASAPRIFDPPGTTHTLSQASHAWTIQVSQSGEITLAKGLPGSSASESPSAPTPTVGQLPTLSQPSGEPPEILRVKGLPEYQDDLPPGIDAMIPEKGILSLQVEAWSPDGEPLYAKWSGPGEFSANEPIPLEWDPIDAVWRGTVEYKLPTTLEEGDDLTLQVRVADRFTDAGLDLIGAVSEPLALEVTEPEGKIVFTELISRSGTVEIQTTNQINDDGTSEVLLYDKALQSPAWSPDGTKLLGFLPDPETGIRTLFVFHPSVGPVKKLYNGDISAPRWSPNGTRISFILNSTFDLCTISADGTGFRQLTPTDTSEVRAGYSWNGDSDQLVYTESDSLGSSPKLWTVNDDGTNRVEIPVPLDEARLPLWIPVDERIAFLGVENAGSSPPHLYTVNPDGTGLALEIDNTSWTSYGWTSETSLGLSSSRRYLSCNIFFMGVNVLRIKDRVSGTVSTINNYQCPSNFMGLWSPVQDRLLAIEPGTQKLISTRPDGSQKLELTRENRSIGQATWGR